METSVSSDIRGGKVDIGNVQYKLGRGPSTLDHDARDQLIKVD